MKSNLRRSPEMKTRVISLLILTFAIFVSRAENVCVESGPHNGAWSCIQQGTLASAGFLTPTSIVACVGETVVGPTSYGTTFNPGKKRRSVTFSCPESTGYMETNDVFY